MPKQYSISVSVSTAYIQDESDPDGGRYVFAYSITITNTGSVAATLLSRRWRITDANDRVQQVQGKGVVGKQPYLKPGDSFHYISATMIETPFGYMQGNYYLIADDGTEFDTEIQPFGLSTPNTLH